MPTSSSVKTDYFCLLSNTGQTFTPVTSHASYVEIIEENFKEKRTFYRRFTKIIRAIYIYISYIHVLFNLRDCPITVVEENICLMLTLLLAQFKISIFNRIQNLLPQKIWGLLESTIPILCRT